MLAIVFALIAAVLGVVQARLKSQLRAELSSTLRREAQAYAEIEKGRREESRESAQLIAEQPTLKALMSTNDPLTVQDASESILLTSRADLLILENPFGKMLALHSKDADVTSSMALPLLKESNGEEDWWFVGGHLYDMNFIPVVSGAQAEERVLGRMALGREIKNDSILNDGAFGRSAFWIERRGHVLLSSMSRDVWGDLEATLSRPVGFSKTEREIEVEGEHYLAASVELPGDHPVRLYCLESFDQTATFFSGLNRMLLAMGGLAVFAGALVVFLLSRQITRPLEQLVIGTRQLQQGDFEFKIPIRGDDEVADLGRAFDEMRETLKKSRESMLRSARLEAVGRLAGGVAHDFNNLVMIIKGYSDLLLDSASPQARSQLEEIKRAGDRASSLTRQLLAFSRKQILEPEILDPNQTVRNLVKMLRVLIGEHIELVTSLSDNAGRVKADPGQLEQVIMNLSVNARDAMPGGGKLIIETLPAHLDESYCDVNSDAYPGDYVLIAVTDNGCGMSKTTLAQIFEPFFTTKEQGKGTGLGLATVYGIVKQSKGHISVYSEIGIGTTFKVYLPSLSLAAPVTPPEQRPSFVKGTGTVLLVEDEPALRSLAAASLKKLGYTVLEASNGVEALKVADSAGGIEVVITDVIMPQMGGPELVQKLRAKQRDVAVILMSGYTEATALEHTNIGSDVVLLNKPFSAETLAIKIQDLQQKRRSLWAKASAAGS